MRRRRASDRRYVPLAEWAALEGRLRRVLARVERALDGRAAGRADDPFPGVSAATLDEVAWALTRRLAEHRALRRSEDPALRRN